MAGSFFCMTIGENLIKVVDSNNSNLDIDTQAIGYLETDTSFYSTDTEKVLQTQSQLISKLLASVKIAKKNVNIIIPDSITYSQILEMPRLNEKELISAIKYQADQFIPMPIDETSIDIEILNENPKNNTLLVLMIAVSKKVVEKIQNTVESSGLIPESIENELSSTGRFLNKYFKTLYPQQTEGIIVVNLAYNSTSLYYYNPLNSLILQNHNFNIGYSLFLKDINVNLNIDIKKAAEIIRLFTGEQTSSISIETIISPILKEFVFELNRFKTLIAEKSQQKVSKIFIINEGFRFPYLPKYLQQNFSIETSQLNIYPICKKTPSIESEKNNLSLYITSFGGNLR